MEFQWNETSPSIDAIADESTCWSKLASRRWKIVVIAGFPKIAPFNTNVHLITMVAWNYIKVQSDQPVRNKLLRVNVDDFCKSNWRIDEWRYNSYIPMSIDVNVHFRGSHYWNVYARLHSHRYSAIAILGPFMTIMTVIMTTSVIFHRDCYTLSPWILVEICLNHGNYSRCSTSIPIRKLNFIRDLALVRGNGHIYPTHVRIYAEIVRRSSFSDMATEV